MKNTGRQILKKLSDYREAVLFCLCAFFFLLSGCTRAVEDKSTANIELPAVIESGVVPNSLAQSVGSLTINPNQKFLRHVVINVSGEGMEPIVIQWNGHDDFEKYVTGASASYNPRTNYSIGEITSGGKSRLIQVIAVYTTSTSLGDMYYGESEKAFNLAEESVEITLGSPVASNQNFSGGRLAGRYLDAGAASGPTGAVQVNYRGSGRRPVTLEKSYIANGWFSFFGLSDIPFDYVLEDGTTLFTQKSLNSFASSYTHVIVEIPDHYRQRTLWTAEHGSKHVIGFFAKDASTLNGFGVCLNTSFVFNKMSSDPSGSPVLGSTYGAANSTNVGYISPSQYSGSCESADGVAATSSQPIFLSNYDGHGNDSVGYQGVIHFTNMERIYKATAVGGFAPKISLLPETHQIVDAVKLYKYVGTSALTNDLDNISCAKTISVSSDWLLVDTKSVASTPVEVVFSNLVWANPGDRLGQALAVCPSKNGKIFDAGVVDKR